MRKMKKWAFYKEGGEWYRIGVYAALDKENGEPGLWRRRTYYSTHFPPNVRLRMNIRKSSRGKFLFAYNPGQDAELERLGGGESLVHYLYKIAISELGQTTLRLGNLDEEIKIQLIETQVEKRVYIGDRYYDIDVYVKFTSSSQYQLRWGGVLGIEVCNTNPVKGQKLKDLKVLGIPIIEVKANEMLAYKTPEEYSTPELEKDYIRFLKGRLEEYLWGKVLSNPKSAEYLEKENAELIMEIKRLNDKLRVSGVAIAQKNRELEQCSMKLERYHSSLIEKDTLLSGVRVDLEALNNMGVFRFIWFKLTGS